MKNNFAGPAIMKDEVRAAIQNSSTATLFKVSDHSLMTFGCGPV